MRFVIGIVFLAIVVIIFFVVDRGLGDRYSSTILNSEPSTYTSCGCGCCAGAPAVEQCIYRSQGQSISDIIETNKNLNPSSEECSLVGCSARVTYKYCDDDPVNTVTSGIKGFFLNPFYRWPFNQL